MNVGVVEAIDGPSRSGLSSVWRAARGRVKCLMAVALGLLMAVPGVYLGSLCVSADGADPAFTYETIDSDVWSFDDAAMAFDSLGRLHIAYYADYNKTFCYGVNSGGSWQFEVVPKSSEGDIYYMAMAIDSQDKVYLAYCLYTYTGGSDLVLAARSGGSWTNEVVLLGPAGTYEGDGVSMAIDSKGSLHLAYASGSGPEYLEYATNAAGHWDFNTFEGIGDVEYDFGISIAVDSQDVCHIAARDYYQNVVYATDASGTWDWSYIWQEDAISTAGMAWTVCISVDTLGGVRVCFPLVRMNTYGIYESSLIYGDRSGTTWSFETAGIPWDTVDYVSLVTDWLGNAHILYRTMAQNYSGGQYRVYYATNMDGYWSTSLLDDRDTSGWVARASISPNNTLHLLYSVYDATTTSRLIHASRSMLPPQPMAWSLSIVGLGGEYVLSGSAHTITIKVLDQHGDPFPGYTGTLHFSSNRTGVTLPADHTLRANDNGVHSFSIRFHANGWFEITCADASTGKPAGTVSNIWVIPEAPRAASLQLSLPSSASANKPFSGTLRIMNQYGGLYKSYAGTVAFSSTDAGAGVVLPNHYTFTSGDAGMHVFGDAFKLVTLGQRTVTVKDVSLPSLSASVGVEVVYRQRTYTFYDMFQDSMGPWWSPNVIITDRPGKVTYSYGSEVNYAPIRYSIDVKGWETMSVSNPEIFPVSGTTSTPGARASIDLYFQYLSVDWWNNYWKPAWNGSSDWLGDEWLTNDATWIVGATYEVTLNRQAALDWLGLPIAADPIEWWTPTNASTYSAAFKQWLYDEQTRLSSDSVYAVDVYAAFVDLATEPDGNVTLKVDTIAYGIEALMTRWLREADISGGYEPWYEDFTLNATYSAGQCSLSMDALAQDTFHAVRANGTEAGAAWVWEPNKIDYWSDWDGDPSVYDPYISLQYLSENAGSTNFGQPQSYEYTPTWFNLSAEDTLIFELPTGTVPGFAGVGIAESGYYNMTTLEDRSAYYSIMRNGTMELGHAVTGWPEGPGLSSMYDPTTKTLTINGPMTFDNNRWESGALYHGAPWIEFAVVRGEPRLSGFEIRPADPYAYQAEPKQMAVVAVDQYGDVMKSYAGTVLLSSSDPTADLPSSITIDPVADAGIHVFTGVFNTLGPQTMTMTDSANVSITSMMNLEVREPRVFAALSVQGSSQMYKDWVSEVKVSARDQYGNVFPEFTGTVSIDATDPSAELSPDHMYTGTDGGVHGFTMTLRTLGSQSVTATLAEPPGISTTFAFRVVQAPAIGSVQINIDGDQVTREPGERFSLTVYVLGPGGQLLTNFTGRVTFSSTDPNATIPQPYTFTLDDGGYRRFIGLAMGTIGGQTITVACGGYTGVATVDVGNVVWHGRTIPEGNHYELRVWGSGETQTYSLDSYGSTGVADYSFMGVSDETYTVGPSGCMVISGQFLYGDDLPYTEVWGRELRAYVLDLAETTIIKSVVILPPTYSTGVWYTMKVTISGLQPGSEIRVGIGRNDVWTAEYYLYAAWRGVRIMPLEEVPNNPPVVTPLPNLAVEVGQAVAFSAVAGDPDGDSFTCRWDFGDGSDPLTGNPVTHTYFAPGVYTYSVNVTDGRGASTFRSATVTIVPEPLHGLLRVTTNPAVASMIYIDGNWASRWSVDYIPLEVGAHTIHFGDVPGFISPPEQTIMIAENQTTYVEGSFVRCSLLKVNSNIQEILSSYGTIFLDGVPRNERALEVYVPPGEHTIGFGPCLHYRPPADANVTLTAGETTTVTGVYAYDPGFPGSPSYTFGRLRVATSPAVTSTICVDGQWMNMWGLDWVKLSPGQHVVSFTDVPGYITPPPQTVMVYANTISNVVGNFARAGSLQVVTTPSLDVTIYVNGIARQNYGLWNDVAPGTYTVSFGSHDGYETPAPQTVTVTAGGYVKVTGDYTRVVPAATFARSTITNGVAITVVSITRPLSWSDVSIELTDGTNRCIWTPSAADLSTPGGTTVNYTALSLGALSVCCWVTDIQGNGAVGGGDSFKLFTYGGATGFGSSVTYSATLKWDVTGESIGTLVTFTG